MKSKTNSINPDDHEGHKIGIDHWAKDFGYRYVSGNGYCFDCLTPVAANVEESKEDPAMRSKMI